MRDKRTLKRIRPIFLSIFIAALLLSPAISFSGGLDIGGEAPFFKVRSGNGEVLTLDDIRGKVTTLFYETKNTKEENRKLKDALNAFYDSQPDAVKQEIVRLPVIKCDGVFFTGEWEKELSDNSKKEGITIYGDWDGKMFYSYGMKDNESNFVIIDKNGFIRHHACGKVDDKGIEAVEKILSSLIKEI